MAKKKRKTPQEIPPGVYAVKVFHVDTVGRWERIRFRLEPASSLAKPTVRRKRGRSK